MAWRALAWAGTAKLLSLEAGELEMGNPAAGWPLPTDPAGRDVGSKVIVGDGASNVTGRPQLVQNRAPGLDLARIRGIRGCFLPFPVIPLLIGLQASQRGPEYAAFRPRTIAPLSPAGC